MGCGASKLPEYTETKGPAKTAAAPAPPPEPVKVPPTEPPLPAKPTPAPTLPAEPTPAVKQGGMGAGSRKKSTTVRRQGISAELDDKNEQFKPNPKEKTEDQIKSIRDGLKSNPLFEYLDDDLITQIALEMDVFSKQVGDVVIKQGARSASASSGVAAPAPMPPRPCHCAHALLHRPLRVPRGRRSG